jgi:hypothetical protein
LNHSNFTIESTEELASNSSSVLSTISELSKTGSFTEVIVSPLFGIYLNYHF